MINQTLPEVRKYNLLNSDTFRKLSYSPGLIREEVTDKDRIVVIDEIQRLPILLNEVQLLIEERNLNFLLTGSSARKMRQGGVNLLGGRARSRKLNPLMFRELKEDFNLLKALNNGLLPSLYFSDSPSEDLRAYANDYLREEIAAEGLVRNISAFSRFLEVAALCNGQMLQYSNVANDAQVPKSTVQEYFQILRDTLIAYDVPAWRQTVKRKSFSTSKFYFFDVGIVGHLQNRGSIKKRCPEFGEAFETYISHELRSWEDYNGQETVHYWRSKSGFEVDFILAETTAIEVKAKENIGEKDLKGLRALREEGLLKNYILVSLEEEPRIVDGIQLLPWKEFLERLWDGAFSP